MSAQHLHLVEEAADTADDERFQILFRRYYGRVKGLAARRFPSCDSDDVAQETMVRVLLNSHRLDPQRDPWPYIAAIAVNVGRDLGRARIPEVALTEESYERELAPAADEPVLRAERCARVQKLLNGLAPGSREVLTLQAFDDMSVGEIARFLGTNDNAVRQKLFRARRQFRKALAGVPSGAFGIGPALVWLRRKTSAANLAQGAGLSLSGAAALVVAVAGAAVVVGSVPNGSAHAGGPLRAVGVTRLRQDTYGATAVTPASALARTAAGASTTGVRTAAPETVALPATGVATVRVNKPGNVLEPGETNNAYVGIPVPGTDSELIVRSYGRNSPGRSAVCPVVELVGHC